MLLATADRFHISIDKMPAAKWDTLSGQEASREVPKVRVEAGGAKQNMPTRIEIADTTVTKVWDSDTDGELYRGLMKGSLYDGATITVQELDADGNTLPGKVVQYTGCVVKGVSRDDADANGQDPLKMTVVWSVGAVAP